MNKTEYLSALKEALKDTDESVMEEIVSDYEEHFQVGLENGKSEEQICEDLGSIEDLVEEIKEVYNTHNKENSSKEDKKEERNANDTQTDDKKGKFKDWYSGIYNIDSEKIGEAINSALDSAGDAISKIDVNEISRNLKSTLDQAANSLNNFADTYIKNQGTAYEFKKRNAEGHKDNVSKSYDVYFKQEEDGKEQTDSDTEADKSDTKDADNTDVGPNLIIDGVCADIFLSKSSNDKINISYENNGNEKQKEMYEFYSYKEENSIYAGIRRAGKAVFFFNLNLYSMKIKIEVPDHMSNISIKTASGDIQIAGVNSNRIIAVAASGNITTDNLQAKFLSLKSTSGCVKNQNITVDVIDSSSLSGNLNFVNLKADECKVRSTSGDIDMNEFSMNNADIGCISGDVKLNSIIGDGLRVSSTSGNIGADINVVRCHASSKSGNVDVQCNGNITLESGTTSGNVNITLKNYNNGYSVESKTTSGALYINYDNIHQRNLGSGTYTYGNQGSKLMLRSISGDIHLSD